MARMDREVLTACSKLARRVFADGFEHREARLAVGRDVAAQQAVLDERGEAVEDRGAPADLLGGFRGKPPANTARRRRSRRSRSLSRSWLQSSAASSVPWR